MNDEEHQELLARELPEQGGADGIRPKKEQKKDLIASKRLRLQGQNQPGEPVCPPQGGQNEPPPKDVGAAEGDQGLGE